MTRDLRARHQARSARLDAVEHELDRRLVALDAARPHFQKTPRPRRQKRALAAPRHTRHQREPRAGLQRPDDLVFYMQLIQARRIAGQQPHRDVDPEPVPHLDRRKVAAEPDSLPTLDARRMPAIHRTARPKNPVREMSDARSAQAHRKKSSNASTGNASPGAQRPVIAPVSPRRPRKEKPERLYQRTSAPARNRSQHPIIRGCRYNRSDRKSPTDQHAVARPRQIQKQRE